MKSDAGKLCEPEPFTRKDPKKLKAFIFQCQLYFRNLDFDSDSNRHLGIGFTKVYLLGSRMNSARAKNLGPYKF
jgi:hypothetical protein